MSEFLSVLTRQQFNGRSRLIAILGVHYGIGKHVLKVGVTNTVKAITVCIMPFGVSNIGPAMADFRAQITFALELIYVICHLAIKLSLLFLYRAVLTLRNPRFKAAWYAVGAYVLAFTAASILWYLFQCTPIHYFWDGVNGLKQGHCVNLKAEVLSVAVLNALADVLLLILPIPTLWNLQLPLKQRVGLCMVFFLGTL